MTFWRTSLVFGAEWRTFLRTGRGAARPGLCGFFHGAVAVLATGLETRLGFALHIRKLLGKGLATGAFRPSPCGVRDQTRPGDCRWGAKWVSVGNYECASAQTRNVSDRP